MSAKILVTKKGVLKRYPSGEVMSDHEGIHLYTIGQSKGLGMTYHEKLFVLKIDANTNTVWVGDEKELYSSEVELIEPHWLSEVVDGSEYEVKIRYQHKASKALVEKTERGIRLKFEEPQRAVAPGQAAVLYKNQKLIGVPFLSSALPNKQIKKILVNAVGFGGNAVSVLVSL